MAGIKRERVYLSVRKIATAQSIELNFELCFAQAYQLVLFGKQADRIELFKEIISKINFLIRKSLKSDR